MVTDVDDGKTNWTFANGLEVAFVVVVPLEFAIDAGVPNEKGCFFASTSLFSVVLVEPAAKALKIPDPELSVAVLGLPLKDRNKKGITYRSKNRSKHSYKILRFKTEFFIGIGESNSAEG